METEDSEEFFDHFTANGWLVAGKTPMRDWKAAMRNWKRRSSRFTGKHQYAEIDYSTTGYE